MKNIIQVMLSVLVLSMAITGCSDDDATTSLNSPLEGTTWTLISESTSGCTNHADNGTTTCSTFCFVITFSASGVFTITDANGTDTATYTNTATTITVTFGTDEETITYVIAHNQLTITHEPDSFDGCTRVEVYVGS